MSKLMDQAREMVNLSRNIAERIRQKKGEITDDEVLLNLNNLFNFYLDH